MKADQPLLELIALKNAINEIEREKLSSKNGDNGHATFKSAGNWPSLSGLAETGSWTAGRRSACPAARGWPSWAAGERHRQRRLARSVRPAASRNWPPACRPRWFAFKTTSTTVPRRVIPVLAQDLAGSRADNRTLRAPRRELWYPRQMRWDGSMKRRTLKWHLLLVLSFLVSCDCTRI